MPVAIDKVRELLQDKFDRSWLNEIIADIDSKLVNVEFLKANRKGTEAEGFQWAFEFKGEGSNAEKLFIQEEYRVMRWRCTANNIGNGLMQVKLQLPPPGQTKR